MDRVPRVLGDCGDPRAGPTLLCVGGVHGNEPCGVAALTRVFEKLRHDSGRLRGRFVGLAGNIQALARGCRFIDADLNRIWWPERVERLETSAARLRVEEREQRELYQRIVRLEQEACGRLFLLDLHSTSGPSPAFVTIEDTLRNRSFSAVFPVPLVLGLEEEIVGTLEGYLSSRGVTTVGFEAGQHDDPRSVDRAEQAVWIALEAAQLLPPGARTEVEAARVSLASVSLGVPRVVEVRHRHPVKNGKRFRMIPGFSGFQPIRKDELLAYEDGQPIAANQEGLLFMPLYQAQGDDGFFIARGVRPFWLTASASLRRLHLERYMHWLPGVERHEKQPQCFVVDRRRARWLAVQLFHLLGFKRFGPLGPRVVLCRRSHDGGTPP